MRQPTMKFVGYRADHDPAEPEMVAPLVHIIEGVACIEDPDEMPGDFSQPGPYFGNRMFEVDLNELLAWSVEPVEEGHIW